MNLLVLEFMPLDTVECPYLSMMKLSSVQLIENCLFFWLYVHRAHVLKLNSCYIDASVVKFDHYVKQRNLLFFKWWFFKCSFLLDFATLSNVWIFWSNWEPGGVYRSWFLFMLPKMVRVLIDYNLLSYMNDFFFCQQVLMDGMSGWILGYKDLVRKLKTFVVVSSY